ncbi:MAG: SDR family oxidoreductase [Planctomycetota bacterium]
MQLDGQVVLVTGANRGIGAAVARMTHVQGATVVATARRPGALDALQDELGERCTPLVLDVCSETSVEGAFAEAVERHGRIDALVANAGIGRYGRLADFSLDDFDAVLATNLRGAFCCCRAAMRHMLPRRSGTIITIASVVGIKGYPEQAAYTASKHGVMGLTKSLAVEAQEHDIRVSAVLPGGVDTDMVAEARPDLDRSILIRPEDIAHTVCFLLGLPSSCAIDQIQVRRRRAAPF